MLRPACSVSRSRRSMTVPAKQTPPSASCRMMTIIKVDWKPGCIYVTSYWTSDECHGHAILTLHLSGISITAVSEVKKSKERKVSCNGEMNCDTFILTSLAMYETESNERFSRLLSLLRPAESATIFICLCNLLGGRREYVTIGIFIDRRWKSNTVGLFNYLVTGLSLHPAFLALPLPTHTLH